MWLQLPLPSRSVFTLIGNMTLCAVSVFCPLGPWLIPSLIILFQGSEWNAANLEELHKNKSVLYLCVLLQYTSGCLMHWMTPMCVLCSAESALQLIWFLYAFQCGLHSERNKGDWQLFPRFLHVYECQSVWRGNYWPTAALDRHI